MSEELIDIRKDFESSQDETFQEVIEIKNLRDALEAGKPSSVISFYQDIKDPLTLSYIRAQALLQPYLFPIPTADTFIYWQNIQRLQDRYAHIIHQSPNIEPEVLTLCLLYKYTDKPDIQALLSQGEKDYLNAADIAEQNPESIDTDWPYAELIFNNIYAELSQLHIDILKGAQDRFSKELNAKLKNIGEIIQHLDPSEEGANRELYKKHHTVSALTNTDNTALWYLELTKAPIFGEDGIEDILEYCDIEYSETNRYMVDQAICITTNDGEINLAQGIQEYAERSLNAIKAFTHYYPDANTDIITYSLLEDLLIPNPEYPPHIEAACFEDLGLAPEQIEQFLTWKAEEHNKKTGDRFLEETPETREQLEAFYACKQMERLRKHQTYLELDHNNHLLIPEVMYRTSVSITKIARSAVEHSRLKDDLKDAESKAFKRLQILRSQKIEPYLFTDEEVSFPDVPPTNESEQKQGGTVVQMADWTRRP